LNFNIRTLSLIFFVLDSLLVISLALTITKWGKVDNYIQNFYSEKEVIKGFIENIERNSERRTLSIRAYALSEGDSFKEDFIKLDEKEIWIPKNIPKTSKILKQIWKTFTELKKLEKEAFKSIEYNNNRITATNILFSTNYYQLKYNLLFLVEKERQRLESLQRTKVDDFEKRVEFYEFVASSLVMTLLLSTLVLFIFLVRKENSVVEDYIYQQFNEKV
jgi:hypothetical protein